jgi:hypothetical protein
MPKNATLLQFQHKVIKRRFLNLVSGLEHNGLVSREALSDLLKVRPMELDQRHFEPSVDQLTSLAESFRFSLDRFYNEEIDLHVIRQHLSGNSLVLSERYLAGGFSKRTVIINMLDFIQKTKGRRLKRLLMDHLYINEAIYNDPNGSVNIRLFEDATQFLLKMGMTHADIIQMGSYTSVTNQGSRMEVELRSQKSVQRMYEFYLTEFIQFVEKNNLYKLKSISPTECLLESHENPELLDILNVRHAGGIGRCLYRAGALSTAPTYLGLPPATITERTCVHRGDAICSFHIDFSHAVQLEQAT